MTHHSFGAPLGVKLIGGGFILVGLLVLLTTAIKVYRVQRNRGDLQQSLQHAGPEQLKQLSAHQREAMIWSSERGLTYLMMAGFLGLLIVGTGVQLIRLRGWARYVVLAVLLWVPVTLAMAVIMDPARSVFDVLQAVLGVSIGGAVVWYFLRPSVKAQFMKSK
jgi:hypothetical protein